MGCAVDIISESLRHHWLDIPPTQHAVAMRYHEFFRIEDEQIVEMQALWDIPQVMMQADAWAMSPSLGVEWVVPSPATQDGIITTPYDQTKAEASIKLVVDMLKALKRSPEGLEAMQLDKYWHPKFLWYGPAGIGTSRRISGFRNWHQIPFLNAMPDRDAFLDKGHIAWRRGLCRLHRLARHVHDHHRRWLVRDCPLQSKNYHAKSRFLAMRKRLNPRKLGASGFTACLRSAWSRCLCPYARIDLCTTKTIIIAQKGYFMTDRPDIYRTTSFQFSPVDQTENIAKKQRIIDIMQNLVNTPIDSLNDVIQDSYHANAEVNVTHPINELNGLDTFKSQLWEPLRHAMPDVERRDDLVAGGRYRDTNWIGCMGHYVGTFDNDWLGIPASRGVINVRFAEGHELRDGKIATSYVFIDFLDLMRQVGIWLIAPSLGREMRWLPPMTHDGVILSPQDETISKQSIDRILKMHAALGFYNGQPPTREVLDEMEMVKHWHPNFMWYGPAGIGTTRGLFGFEDYHQMPFLVAFPDRGGSEKGHFIRIGDGYYAVTGGWGYLRMTHTGNDFLGMPPTNKQLNMRVMDFYRCDDETIVENWIPIDIPHVLLQMGVDVFGRMRHQFRQHNPISASDWLVKR